MSRRGWALFAGAAAVLRRARHHRLHGGAGAAGPRRPCCRAQRDLMCTANLTERECDRASKHALCDEWFWRERLACWNWGYGG